MPTRRLEQVDAYVKLLMRAGFTEDQASPPAPSAVPGRPMSCPTEMVPRDGPRHARGVPARRRTG